MNTARTRHWRRATGVAGALVVAVTAAAVQPDPDTQAPRPAAARRPATATPGTGPIDSLPLERLKRERAEVRGADAFRAKSWYVPPPAPPPAPPPPPTAPPLPFTFMGKIQEPNGKLTIFLSGANRVYLVSAGETIDQLYHVDGIENGKLALTYLPLQIKQFLSMGETP